MTRLIVAAIAFAFGAAMSAQAGDVSPPSFGPSGCANSTFFSCKDARPVSQVETTPKREAPRGTDARAASNTQPTNAGTTPSPNSTAQEGSNRVSPRQSTAAIRDPSAARAADELIVAAKPGHAAYKIGPQDVLEISVFQAPDLSGTVEVDETGTIDLPLIGETRVAGKTSAELQRDLSSKLGAKYLQNPQVTVRVKEFNSNRVTVSGAVKNPGVFPYKGETLLQYVVKAGGLAEESNSMVLVLRESNGKRSAAKFNIADIEKGRAPDPTMQSGDVIVADTSSLKRGYKNLMKVLPIAGFAALL